MAFHEAPSSSMWLAFSLPGVFFVNRFLILIKFNLAVFSELLVMSVSCLRYLWLAQGHKVIILYNLIETLLLCLSHLGLQYYWHCSFYFWNLNSIPLIIMYICLSLIPVPHCLDYWIFLVEFCRFWNLERWVLQYCSLFRGCFGYLRYFVTINFRISLSISIKRQLGTLSYQKTWLSHLHSPCDSWSKKRNHDLTCHQIPLDQE